MVSDRQRVESQPNALLDQFLGIAHPVQEAEVAVTVQLRVRHYGTGWTFDALFVGLVRGPFVRVSGGIVAVWIVLGVVRHGPARHPTFQLSPRNRRIVPAHQDRNSDRAPMEGGGASGHAFRLRATTTPSGSSAICSERSEQFNSVIASFCPPLIVLDDQQPGTAVKIGDLKPRDLSCLIRFPPQFVNGPGTCPSIDRHQIRFLANADEGESSGQQSAIGDFYRLMVFAQHNRWHRRCEYSGRCWRRNAARPGQLRVALGMLSFTPGAKQLAVSWAAAPLQRGS